MLFKRLVVCVLSIILVPAGFLHAQTEPSTESFDFTICRIKYGGGGDWYSDPSSLPNLHRHVRERLGLSAPRDEVVRELTDRTLGRYPLLYMTGHGEIRFTPAEVRALREHLINGGFLWADDNYGLDVAFRREIRRVFPETELVLLPDDHEIFHCFYEFPDGLPAIHEHDPDIGPQALAIFHEGRMVVLFTYQSDIGDGLEDYEVHPNPPAVREAAARMAINIIFYAMTH